ATLALAIDPMIYYLVNGEEQPIFQRGSASQAYVLRCRDGVRLCLHMSSPDKFWYALAKAIGRPELIQKYPDRQSRSDNYEELSTILSSVFRQRDRSEWMSILEEHDVPFSPELSMEELTRDPQAMHLGILNETYHENLGAVRGVNRPLHFDGNNES